MLNLATQEYDLYEFGTEWLLHVKGGPIYSGNFYKVTKHAVVYLGFDIDTIEFAIQEMIKYPNHNAIRFGSQKEFKFTFEFKQKAS